MFVLCTCSFWGKWHNRMIKPVVVETKPFYHKKIWRRWMALKEWCFEVQINGSRYRIGWQLDKVLLGFITFWKLCCIPVIFSLVWVHVFFNLRLINKVFQRFSYATKPNFSDFCFRWNADEKSNPKLTLLLGNFWPIWSVFYFFSQQFPSFIMSLTWI